MELNGKQKELQFDVNKTVDFDLIMDTIEKNKDKKILLIGDDRQLQCILIAYYIYKQKMNINIASMKVFNLMGRINTDKILYN